MSLLFNMLSRLVIAFLPRSKCLLISWLQSPSVVILELNKIKSDTGPTVFPIYFPRSDGTRCHDLSFLNVVYNAGQFFSKAYFLGISISCESPGPAAYFEGSETG